MALVINHNIASLIAQHNVGRTSDSLNLSLERLSSGLKINRGADGPAALVISEEQRAQISGLQTAIDNASKATSLVQTAEGALTEINSLLVKARGLALDSANNGVQDANSLAANQAEIQNILSTIDRIAANTQFGVRKILDGSAGFTGSTDNASATFLKATDNSTAASYAFTVTTAGAKATTDAGTAQTAALNQAETLTINGVQIQLAAGLSQDQVIQTINQYTGQTGVVADNAGAGGATRLISTQFGSGAKISVQSNVAGAADSTGFGLTAVNVAGTDVVGTIGGVAATGVGNVLTGNAGAGEVSVQFALATGDLVNTVSGAGAAGNVAVEDHSLFFQIGANANQTASVAIDGVSSSALGVNVAGSQFANLAGINVQSEAGAQDALKVIDQAISDVSTLRGRLGAFQAETLASTANNLQATLENTTAAESVIRDTDFAAETANFTKQQVLLQAGTTVLSNANQVTGLIAQLLQGR